MGGPWEMGGVGLKDALPLPGEESHEHGRAVGSAGVLGWLSTVQGRLDSNTACFSCLALSLQSNANIPGAEHLPPLPQCGSRSCPPVQPGAEPRQCAGAWAAQPLGLWRWGGPRSCFGHCAVSQREGEGTVPARAVRWQQLCAGSSHWHSEGGCFPEWPAPVPGLTGAVLTSMPGRPESLCCSQLSRAFLLCSFSCLLAPRVLPRAPGGLGPLCDRCLP